MDRAEIASRTKSTIANILGVDEGDVSETSAIIDDLGADSLDVAEVVMALEDEFKILIEDDQVEHLHTVGQAIDFIFAKTG